MQTSTERLNERFNALFFVDSDGNYHPNVCSFCDQFIMKASDVDVVSFETLRKHSSCLTVDSTVSAELKNCYYVDGRQYDNRIPWDELLLSRRTFFVTSDDRRESAGIVSCSRCKRSVSAGEMPKFAISNGFYFGYAPQCLSELTEVELALLTPVKTHGYCFSYSGGFQKELKGSLSYYKVKHESIARTVAHFSVLGVTGNIVVLLHGTMTVEQREKARRKNVIRTENVKEALKWLCIHNMEWRSCNIDVDALVNSLRNPTLIDNSILVEGSTTNNHDGNIESRESFQVFFPDGSVDDCTGAQRGIEEFRELVKQCKSNGFDLQLQADLMRTAVSDYQGNNLVNTCLLQFPYGRGGLREKRQLNNGKIGEMDIITYVSHVSTISNPCFHHELFVLILYNMKMKLNMVRSANWKVRHNSTAHMLSTELNEEDIELAIRGRKHGHTSNSHGEQYLKAIDAIARSVPHTNEAAKKARRRGECLQHHFGVPTHFLTVTPDDDSSILVQVLSGERCDLDDASVDGMSVEEISRRAQERTRIRLRFPGVCAIVFEMLLDLIVEEVIGWDLSTGRASTHVRGYFGTPEAFTASVEEQGRRTLHVHFQIWIKEVREAREKLFSANRLEERNAIRFLCTEADRTMSTSCFFGDMGYRETNNRIRMAFPHECTKLSNARRPPAVVEDQTLRELRYKAGSLTTGHTFAYCLECTKTWTINELLKSYVQHGVEDSGYAACDGEGDLAARMKAKAIEYQKNAGEQRIPTYIIEAGYNFHAHTTSCFRRALKGKQLSTMNREEKKLARKRVIECECRYRLPVRKKRRTAIEDASESGVKWYSWTGTHDVRPVKELCLRRSRYDLFQNQSCPLIGQSKFACNTNINLQFHGCTGQYSFKYNFKNTQADDREEFDRLVAQKDRILSKLNGNATPRAEATRRLLVGAFAHQRANICGGPMSSFLTRKSERFLFSHETVWIPLRDLKSLLIGNSVSSSIIYHTTTPFFQCVALHYLARPKELEGCCTFEYYSRYEFIRLTCKNEADLLLFCNTDNFQHPSFRKGSFLQGVRERRNPVLAQIFQYDFPDTAEFEGDILSVETITEAMERYAELVLLLFCPYRCREDILLNGSFTMKLRAVAGTFTDIQRNFLQNIQDAKSNCFRTTKLEDDLQRCTHAVKSTDYEEHYQNLGENDEEEEDDGYLQGALLDNFLDLLNQECAAPDVEGAHGDEVKALDQDKIKKKGGHRCGYTCLASMTPTETTDSPFIIVQGPLENLPVARVRQSTALQDHEPPSRTFFKGDLVKVILDRRSRKTRSFKDITGLSDNVDVYEANGCVASIVDWARKAKLDPNQRRAFEIIVGTFLLTFYDDAADDGDGRRSRHMFVTQKKALEMLVETQRRRKRQLICLLHGPGGSGKTTVIDLTMEYAREYCSYLEGVQFTSRTIVVTALTGVAATLLRGETTHSAVFLNQKRAIEAEQIEIWEETRLLLVDEISFASKTEFVALDKNLRCLMQRPDLPYGGLSIVFSGDFRQLEPIGMNKKPVYDDYCAEFTEWINSYIELNGLHRYAHDLPWGKLLYRMRYGEPTKEDVDTINSRVVSTSTVLPPNIRYATYFNRDRDAINTALFEKRCDELLSDNVEIRDSILILSDKLEMKNGTGIWTQVENAKFFWESCGEDDIKLPRGAGRMDPVLRLYKNCPVMLPTNIDVKSGEANGTQAFVEAIVLKNGETMRKVAINDFVSVQYVRASQVAYVELRHANARISPRIFRVVPKVHTFKAKVLKPTILRCRDNDRETIEMRGMQVPTLVNNATTGHKLQGSGVEKLFVHCWSYVSNWVYVMLSRVKTMEGLYLRQPLSTDLTKYRMSDKLRAMMQFFRQKHSPTIWDDHDYEEKFGIDNQM